MSAGQVGEGRTTSEKQILGAKIFWDQRHSKKQKTKKRKWGKEKRGRDGTGRRHKHGVNDKLRSGRA